MKTEPNLNDADALYEALIECHEGLSEADSQRLNMRLILLLANQIGDQEVLRNCIAAARASL